MKKVKAIFAEELYSLHYLNNRYITNFQDYIEMEAYCMRNNFSIVSVSGLD